MRVIVCIEKLSTQTSSLHCITLYCTILHFTAVSELRGTKEVQVLYIVLERIPEMLDKEIHARGPQNKQQFVTDWRYR